MKAKTITLPCLTFEGKLLEEESPKLVPGPGTYLFSWCGSYFLENIIRPMKEGPLESTGAVPIPAISVHDLGDEVTLVDEPIVEGVPYEQIKALKDKIKELQENNEKLKEFNIGAESRCDESVSDKKVLARQLEEVKRVNLDLNEKIKTLEEQSNRGEWLSGSTLTILIKSLTNKK